MPSAIFSNLYALPDTIGYGDGAAAPLPCGVASRGKPQGIATARTTATARIVMSCLLATSSALLNRFGCSTDLFESGPRDPAGLKACTTTDLLRRFSTLLVDRAADGPVRQIL